MGVGKGRDCVASSPLNTAFFTVPYESEAQRVPVSTACWKGCFRDVASRSPNNAVQLLHCSRKTHQAAARTKMYRGQCHVCYKETSLAPASLACSSGWDFSLRQCEPASNPHLAPGEHGSEPLAPTARGCACLGHPRTRRDQAGINRIKSVHPAWCL